MGKRKLEQAQGKDEDPEEQQEDPSDPEQKDLSSGGEDLSGSDEEGSSGSESGSSSGGDDDSDSGPEVSDEQEGDSDDPDDFDRIDVNFEFFDPKEADFHGLKALLHSYLDGQQYDSSQLIDAIIQQPQVGTVVRTGEDEDPIAVMTVLNTQQHAKAGFLQQIKAHMLDKCKDAATKQQLSKAWEQPGTGLIINERLINSPPQLAPPLVQALFSEIGWATEDEPSQERRDLFKFKQYLLMTRVFSDPLPPEQQQQQQQGAAGASTSGKGKPPAGPGKPPQAPQQQPAKKQKQQQQQQAGGPVVVYVRPEDEYFHKQATASFTFPIEGRAVGKDELQPLRLVMLLPANKVAAARSALDAVVGNMAEQR